MNNEVIKNILINSGVVVTDCSNQYDYLFEKIKSVFLTQENTEWLKNQYEEHIKRLSYFSPNIPIDAKFDEDNCLYWELFSFERLHSLKNEEAISAFNQLQTKECFILQITNYNLDSNNKPAYLLKGSFDISNIDDFEEFKLLKNDIIQDVSIPYWVIDNISQSIGKEIYVFDINMSWILVLTHENDIFFYMVK
jgi:hypothetical protein